MTLKQNLELKIVDKSDLEFLYELLKNRNPDANISHKKMPSYDEHTKFVLSNPYTTWYVILVDGKKTGSIYLSKQDEIGIFLLSENIGKGIGGKSLEMLMKKNPRNRYLANVNPKNKKSIKFFENNNFKLIQYTYELMTTNSK
jgi:RimJ/RimL family protein N-acetyltransferase